MKCIPIVCVLLVVVALAQGLRAAGGSCRAMQDPAVGEAGEKPGRGAQSKTVESKTVETLTLEMVCENAGAKVPRDPGKSLDAGGAFDRKDRSVFWLLGATRCDTPAELRKRLGARIWAKPGTNVVLVAGPSVCWQEVFEMFLLGVEVGGLHMRFPGEWKEHPCQLGVVMVPTSDDGLVSAPGPLVSWGLSAAEQGHQGSWVAEFQVLQDGKVRVDGEILFDPKVDKSDRHRLTDLLAKVAVRAEQLAARTAMLVARAEAQGEEGQTLGDGAIGDGVTTRVFSSRVLLRADKWADWQSVYLLMKDMTECKPALLSFHLAASAQKRVRKEPGLEKGPVEKGPVEKGPVEKAPLEKAPLEKAPLEKAPLEKAK
jgi:hypothetical protein